MSTLKINLNGINELDLILQGITSAALSSPGVVAVTNTAWFGTGNATIAGSLPTTCTGSHNTAAGQGALATNTQGSDNTAFGFGADVASADLTNVTVIGYGVVGTASNQVSIGNSSVTSTVLQGMVTALTVNAALNGSLGATTPNTVHATTGTFTGTVTAPTVDAALNGSVGATTPSTGVFTTLTSVNTSGTVMTIGNSTSSPTSTPAQISLGGTYSPTAGANPKVLIHPAGYGFGLSSASLDYIAPQFGNHNFWVFGTNVMSLGSSGNLSVAGSFTAAGPVKATTLSLTSSTTATSAVAGSATALPTAPLGYLEITVNGTAVLIPYYTV